MQQASGQAWGRVSMGEPWAALAISIVSLLAICFLTCRDEYVRHDAVLRVMLPMAWLASSGVAAWRISVDEGAVTAMYLTALLVALVILATLGRPALVMMDAFKDDGSPDGHRLDKRARRRGHVGQAVFIAAAIVLAIWQTV